MKGLPAALAAGLVLLGGCTAVPAQVVTVTAPPASVSPTPEPTVDGWANAQAFADAALKGDYDTASNYVSANGAAARYLEHQRAMNEASTAAGLGSTEGPDDVTFDADEGSVTYTYTDGPTVTWKAFEYDSAGMVISWSTGKSATKLSDRLWTKPAKASTAHAVVELVSAYKNDAGLFVVLDVKAKDRALSPDC